MRKVIITVAPVSHTNVKIPRGIKNPVTVEEVAKEVLECSKKRLQWSICMYGITMGSRPLIFPVFAPMTPDEARKMIGISALQAL